MRSSYAPYTPSVGPAIAAFLLALQAGHDVIPVPRIHSATVPACGGPIAVNPISHEVFDVCYNAIAAVDEITLETSVIPIVPICNVGGVAVDAGLNKVYVTDYGGGLPDGCSTGGGGLLTIMDPDSGTSTVLFGGGRTSPVVNPETHKIYLSPGIFNGRNGFGFSGISVVDGVSLEQHGVETPTGPASIAIDSKQNRIYVACAGDLFTLGHSLVVIDGATDATVNLTVGDGPIDVAVDPRNDIVAVSNSGAGVTGLAGPHGKPSVVLLDASTLVVKATIPFDSPLGAIDVDFNAGKIYVAGGAFLVEIDEGTLHWNVIPLNGRVIRMVVDSATHAVYVLEQGSNSVFRIDGVSREVTEIPIGPDPRDLALDPVSNTVWVSTSGDMSLTVLLPGARTLPARPASQ
jgi:DNA-binding beta-propeller fold protein YncE